MYWREAVLMKNNKSEVLSNHIFKWQNSFRTSVEQCLQIHEDCGGELGRRIIIRWRSVWRLTSCQEANSVLGLGWDCVSPQGGDFHTFSSSRLLASLTEFPEVSRYVFSFVKIHLVWSVWLVTSCTPPWLEWGTIFKWNVKILQFIESHCGEGRKLVVLLPKFQ